MSPLDLGAVTKEVQPARAKYMGSDIQLKYLLGVITPAWSESLNRANAAGADEFVGKILELVREWDITSPPPAIDLDERGEENGETLYRRYEPGDLVAAEGKAFRCSQGGMAGSLSGDDYVYDEAAHALRTGSCVFEAEGPADASYPVPLSRWNVSHVPAPVLAVCIQGVMQAANSGVGEQKKG